MNKLLLSLLLLTLSGVSQASSDTAATGIIEPYSATGGIITTGFTYSAKGDLLVCAPYYGTYSVVKATCKDKAGNTAWRLLQHSVPVGKVYVGFKFSTVDVYTMIEVYWK